LHFCEFLTRLVDRDIKNVHQELTELERLGIIRFETTGQSKQPVFFLQRDSDQFALCFRWYSRPSSRLILRNFQPYYLWDDCDQQDVSDAVVDVGLGAERIVFAADNGLASVAVSDGRDINIKLK